MMPNICSQKDTPCILLHRVVPDGELKEVAEGMLIQPLSRDMHNNRMSEAVMRVKVTEVLPEFSGIDPPMQPPGAEKHMLLGNCPKWVLEWPKTQIRLGGLRRRSTGATSKPRKPIVRPSKPPRKPVGKEPAPQAAVATTRKEPPVVATTSRHQRLLGMYVR